MTIKISIDENIPYAKDIFANHGDIQLINGRSVTNSQLADSDALVIRSVTKVDQKLVLNSRIKFIGTCTIGTDHVDQQILRKLGIEFKSAPGCNAQAVAEYVITNILSLCLKEKETIKGKSIGIIGVGNVGKIVEKYTHALGMEIFLCDPPRKETENDFNGVDINEALSCDFITFHVPLNKDGAHPTFHMLNKNNLKDIKSSSVLINSCRGEIINNEDLKIFLQNNSLKSVILDVWENEPNPDQELLQLTSTKSPHVAGYTFDAKIRGAQMIASDLCHHFALKEEDISHLYEAQKEPILIKNTTEWNLEKTIFECCQNFYDPNIDDKNMDELVNHENPAIMFDNLRKNYRKRREFQTIPLKFESPIIDQETLNILRILNFRIENI